jgi:aminoglycoside phosphotransferase (APT) family kinase protein
VPQILRGLRSAQRTLLKRTMALLLSAKTVPPITMIEAAEATPPKGAAGEADIAYYEMLVAAIAEGIGALSAHPQLDNQSKVALNGLCRAATRLETKMRAEYKTALAALRDSVDSGVAVAPPDAEPTAAQLTSYLRMRFPEHAGIEVSNLRRLPGDNAQEIYFCDLAGYPGWDGSVVLRRASKTNPTDASMANEYLLLNHAQSHGLPVPRVLMAERDTAHLGGEFSILQRLPGAPRAPAQFGRNARAIGISMAQTLARLHQLDARALPAPYTHRGESHADLMLAKLDNYYRRWREGRIESSLVLESAFSWMRAHVDCLSGPVVMVHGDCNHRNWLLDGDRISALLDWELAHLGHPAEDLAYIRPDIIQVMPWKAFIAAYRDAGGPEVSDQQLGYLDVWTNVWRTAMATWVYSGYARAKHRNFMYASVSHNEYHVNQDALGAYMNKHAYRWS